VGADLSLALLLFAGVVLFSLWWAIKTFDQTEGLRRWAEEMKDREEDERG
jgi:hypothetical protein